MTDLDQLIASVEAGNLSAGFTNDGLAYFDHWVFVWQAYDGSLDAAHRLHDALLPGWRVKELHQFEAGHWLAGVYQPKGDDWPKWTEYPTHEATNDLPARAWLLAILRATAASRATVDTQTGGEG